MKDNSRLPKRKQRWWFIDAKDLREQNCCWLAKVWDGMKGLPWRPRECQELGVQLPHQCQQPAVRLRRANWPSWCAKYVIYNYIKASVRDFVSNWTGKGSSLLWSAARDEKRELTVINRLVQSIYWKASQEHTMWGTAWRRETNKKNEVGIVLLLYNARLSCPKSKHDRCCGLLCSMHATCYLNLSLSLRLTQIITSNIHCSVSIISLQSLITLE